MGSKASSANAKATVAAHPARRAKDTQPPAWVPGPVLHEQAAATAEQLKPHVAANKITTEEAQLLTTAVSRPGVMGEANVVRAVDKFEALSAPDQAKFRTLVAEAPDHLHGAYLWKDLGAGHQVVEVADFAQQISSIPEAELPKQLSLADSTSAFGGAQSGLKQQFGNSCAPSTVQMLHAEADPEYALRVRRESNDIRVRDEEHPYAANHDLAEEQGQMLVAAGSSPWPTGGMEIGEAAKLMNERSGATGYRYEYSGDLNPYQRDQAAWALDSIANQLRAGIKTPVTMGNHIMLFTDVNGEGPEQEFVYHDPNGGESGVVRRSRLMDSEGAIHDAERVGYDYVDGFMVASPVEPSLPNPKVAPMPPRGQEKLSQAQLADFLPIHSDQYPIAGTVPDGFGGRRKVALQIASGEESTLVPLPNGKLHRVPLNLHKGELQPTGIHGNIEQYPLTHEQRQGLVQGLRRALEDPTASDERILALRDAIANLEEFDPK